MASDEASQILRASGIQDFVVLAVIWAEQPHDDRWMYDECRQCRKGLSGDEGGFLWFRPLSTSSTYASVLCFCSRRCLDEAMDEWTDEHGVTDVYTTFVPIGSADLDDEPYDGL